MKELKLRRETVRNLNSADLWKARGGANLSFVCTTPCNISDSCLTQTLPTTQ